MLSGKLRATIFAATIACVCPAAGAGLLTTFVGASDAMGCTGLPTLDGTPIQTTTVVGTSIGGVLTTTLSSDVIFVAVLLKGTTLTLTSGSITDTSGLTWTLAGTSFTSTNAAIGFFTAVSAGVLAADTITVTSGATVTSALLYATGISGANTTTPIDPNAGNPAFTNNASSSTSTVNISTTSAATIIFSALGVNTSAGVITEPSGFNTQFQSINRGDVALESVCAAQVANAVTYNWATPAINRELVLAIQ